MQLFHLGDNLFANQLNGEGAWLFGGRWNESGKSCIYTSATRSLCILEYIANVLLENIPPELSITEYFIPDELCRTVKRDELPDNWFEIPPPLSAQSFGSRLLTDANCTCFAVPSVVVRAELNFILNPAATGFSQIKITRIENFVLDSRIKR